MKKHIRFKNTALCGVRSKRKLLFVADESEVTCLRCKRAKQR